MFVWSSKDVKRLKANNGRVKAASNRYLSCCKENKIHFKNIWHSGGPKFLCFIVNNTLHELYFGRVVIFWIKYNEAPAELYLIQNITTRSKYNECTYYLF